MANNGIEKPNKLVWFVLMICGGLIVKELLQVFKNSGPLYINDASTFPAAILSTNNTIQDSEHHHSELQWPNEDTEKFARILVVSLKRWAYDPLNNKWQDDYWAKLCAVLRKINPSEQKETQGCYRDLIADGRVAPLLWKGGHCGPTFKVGSGQIYRIAEILAHLAPFNPNGLSLIDPDTSSTDKLLADVLARANEAAATFPNGTKDLSHITLTAEEKEIVDWKKFDESIRDIMLNVLTIAGGPAMLAMWYKERQHKLAMQAHTKGHVTNQRTIEYSARRRGPQNDFV